MPKGNFWAGNNQENIKKLKQLIKINPGITNAEIAAFFGKGITAIEAIKRRYNVRAEIDNISDGLSVYKPIKWRVKPTQIGKLKPKEFKTYLVSADHHIPHINQFAVKSVLRLMDDVEFDGFILLGDYMDMEPIAHWLQDKHQNKSLENKRMLSDYIEGNKLLDEFDKRLPKGCDKRYFWGNHERFYLDLIEKMPALEGLLDPTIELKLKERGYIVYPVNHIERIGRLSLCHGMYHNQNYVLKHINEFKTNVMHADLHSPRMRFETSPAKEIAIAGYCLGAMCDLNPDYMKNRAHKWSHGFAVLYLYQDGFFDIDLKRIVKGKFIYNNHLYDGNI